jgi:hypothetical protein
VRPASQLKRAFSRIAFKNRHVVMVVRTGPANEALSPSLWLGRFASQAIPSSSENLLRMGCGASSISAALRVVFDLERSENARNEPGNE